MKKWITYSFFISLLFIVACATDKENKKGAVAISGKLSNIDKGTIILEELTPTEIHAVDSAVIDAEGTFLMTLINKEPKFYRLRLGQNDFVTLIIDSTSNIHVTGDAKDLPSTYSVSGSASSELLHSFNEFILNNQARIDSLENIYSQAQAKGAVRLDSLSNVIIPVFNQIVKEKENYIRTFIDHHRNSLVALAAINYLNPDIDFPYFQKTDSSLTKFFPKSIYATDFHKRVQSLSKLAIGSMAPEIILSNPEGEQVALSSLRGKIVLLDFWASWCGPCRKESPNMVKLYNKYKDRGLSIYSVSLDMDPKAWVKAINDDDLNWIHVSDLKHWDSAAAKLYNVQGIPFTYLINKEGKIIAKALHGKELEVKLEEVFRSL